MKHVVSQSCDDSVLGGRKVWHERYGRARERKVCIVVEWITLLWRVNGGEEIKMGRTMLHAIE